MQQMQKVVHRYIWQQHMILLESKQFLTFLFHTYTTCFYHCRCVEYLIQHKADPILKDKRGFTPVHYAVAGRNIQALGHLLIAVSGKCTLYGSEMPLTTPLHLAVYL